jgi:soluble lytic murein transglycosylase-like protein/predicted negative regulator of RcsB-dependent stress response
MTGRLAVSLLFILSLACAQQSSAPPPEPAPAAINEPEIETISEARQLLLQDDPEGYEQALAKIAVSTREEKTRSRALALRAVHLHQQKEWADAVPALRSAADANPLAAPFLRLRLAEALVALDRIDEAMRTLDDVASLEDSTASTIARLRLPALHARLDDPAATETAWRRAMQITIDELTESDFVEMAKALAAAGRGDLAAQSRLRILSDYTSGRFTEQTYGLAKESVHALPESERIALAEKLSRANRFDQALDLFATIPETSEHARAVRLRALFNSRNYTRLLDETKKGLTDPALMLMRARAAWRAGRPKEFLAGLEEIEKKHPASRQVHEARILRAKYYVSDEIDYGQAIHDLSRAVDAGAHGNDGENLWTLGWTYTLAGKYDDALRVYDRYIRTYPDGDWKTNSLFWSAKILEKKGHTDERDAKAAQILAEYPFSYYSYRVKELWPSAASRPAAPAAVFPDLESELASIGETRLETVRELMEIGLERAAAREMKVIAGEHPSSSAVQFMLADVYVRAGEPFKANVTLQRNFRQFIRHGGQNIPQRFWEILYPLAYWETIEKEAARRELDPYFVASVIRQESAFEPSTVSNAGAVGLMQIMPEEAPRIAEAGGLPAVTRGDLFDPTTNIAVGAAELQQKIARMNGNLVLAVAAYNAGEKAVGTWLELTPIDDLDLFVESIPYAETRLYVKTVNRNRFEYRRIYETAGIDSAAVQTANPNSLPEPRSRAVPRGR